ncbi:hypothetical protein [Nocardia abscessus]|uniref:hypothetical protein n=1 Tax=Nocardia abscessus TaxID=120957 RepID=UPI0024547D06|nr:hypothetical protein [Nocardia abscessus]
MTPTFVAASLLDGGRVTRSPAAVRQLAARARRHVHARRPRHRIHPDMHAQVTERFAAAALGGGSIAH